jgi:hypothetical protein
MRPRGGFHGIVLDHNWLGRSSLEEGGVPERALGGTDVEEAGVDAGYDNSLAAPVGRRIKDMFQDPGQCGLPEGDVGILGGGANVDAGPSTNAVLEDGKTGVDLSRFLHALGRMSRLVTRCFGSSEINKVEDSVIGLGQFVVDDANLANGVRARRRAVLQCWLGAAEGGGVFNAFEKGLRVSDLNVGCSGKVGRAKRVLEDGNGFARVEKIIRHLARQLDDRNEDGTLAFAFVREQHLSNETLEAADGERLAGSSLTIGEQGADTARPCPRNEGLDQRVVNVIGGVFGAEHPVDGVAGGL